MTGNDAAGFDLADALSAVTEGRPLVFEGVSFVRCRVHGEVMHFATDFLKDPIQKAHRGGRFYEAEELSLIRQVFPPGGVFVDIGANVGNHGLYAARFLHATKVIPFEPNPRAYRMLLANVLANGLEGRFDLGKLGFGAGADDSGGFGIEDRKKNLGGTRMLPGQGEIEVRRVDSLLADITPDFIKIDVEGMEMQVLAGLSGVLGRCSPWMLVEVDVVNEEAFRDWASENGYVVHHTLQHYAANRNHLLRPRRRRLARVVAGAEAREEPVQ